MTAVAVCEVGTIASDTSGSGEPAGGVTVKVAVPAATVPSAFVPMAEMVVVPAPTAVARPPPLIVAIVFTLDAQVT